MVWVASAEWQNSSRRCSLEKAAKDALSCFLLILVIQLSNSLSKVLELGIVNFTF